jgi:hypothetical protein
MQYHAAMVPARTLALVSFMHSEHSEKQGWLHLAALVCALTLMPACGDHVTLEDSIGKDDTILDFYKGKLNSPYVRGAAFHVFASGMKVPQTAEVISLDEEILDPKNSDPKTTYFKARESGPTELQVMNNGQILLRQPVDVIAANRVTLHFHGDAMFRQATKETEVLRPKIVVGGRATFLVRYYKDDVRLNGTGVLSVDAPNDTEWIDNIPILGELSREYRSSDHVETRVVGTYFGADRDWLQIIPLQEGSYTMVLRADGDPIGEITVDAVSRDSIEAVSLRRRTDIRGRGPGRGLVLAEAFDIDGNAIYGLDYRWQRDGEAVAQTGDLYLYERGGSQTTLSIRTDQHESAIQIRAGRGHVESTNEPGCDTAASSEFNPVSALAICLGLLALRRRRENT